LTKKDVILEIVIKSKKEIGKNIRKNCILKITRFISYIKK